MSMNEHEGTPAHYPHKGAPGPAENPPNPFMKTLAIGSVALLVEPSGRNLRATVTGVEPFAVVVKVKVGPFPALTRAFAVNGYELGAEGEPAELRAMPIDKADRLRRRELFYELLELLEASGEELLPVDALEFLIWTAKRYARQRAEEAAGFWRDLATACRRAAREAEATPKPPPPRLASGTGTRIVWTNAFQNNRTETDE